MLAAALLGACGGATETDRAGDSSSSRPSSSPSSNAAPGATSTAGRQAERRPVAASPGAPVILISIDTLRSDRLPAYGYTGIATPALDRLAADGILFERAYSHYPLTLPAHASLLTGLLPPRHGVRDNKGFLLDAAAQPWLPRQLAEAGYATGAFVSTHVLRGETGMAADFDRYDDEIDRELAMLDAGRIQRPGDLTSELAIGWLEEVHRLGGDGGGDGGPPFLFFHIYEPHTPYEPPEPYASRYDDPYDGEIAFADAIVGELLDALRRLDLYDPALIVLLSDHGEGLGDHGEAEHGLLLYRESLQVPMIVKLPASAGGDSSDGDSSDGDSSDDAGGASFPRAGERAATPVQLVDVFPTVLEVLGMAPPGGPGARLAGASLLAAADGALPADRAIYAETWYPRRYMSWSELTSLIAGPHHLIWGPEPELYDLLEDPGETENLAAAERRAFAGLRDRLQPLSAPLSEADGEVDSETARKLAALGYLSSPVKTTGDGPLPDPKARIHTLEAYRQGTRLLEAGDVRAAEEQLSVFLAENEGMPDAWKALGTALSSQGRLAEAIDAYRKAVELTGPEPRSVAQLVQLFNRVGRHRESEALLGVAIELNGPDPLLYRQLALTRIQAGRPADAIALLEPVADERLPLLVVLGEAYYAAGRLPAAARTFDRVLERSPDHPKGLEGLGGIALAQRRPAEARQLLERAVARRDDLPNAWNSLGVARQLTGDTAGALAAWQRAVEQDPRMFDALYNLGLTAAGAGRSELARRSLERLIDDAPPERYGGEIARAREVLRQLGDRR